MNMKNKKMKVDRDGGRGSVHVLTSPICLLEKSVYRVCQGFHFCPTNLTVQKHAKTEYEVSVREVFFEPSL